MLRRSRMIPDAEDEDEEANRQIRKVKKGEKNSKSAERSVARGERENIVKTMIPPNTNQKPDEPVPPSKPSSRSPRAAGEDSFVSTFDQSARKRSGEGKKN